MTLSKEEERVVVLLRQLGEDRLKWTIRRLEAEMLAHQYEQRRVG